MRPLKGYKGTYFEGGIRVPFFVNWPKIVNPQSRCSTPITGVDIYPTLCDMINNDNKSKHNVDGVSIVPLLKGKKIPSRNIYWHFPAYLQSYQQRQDEQKDPLFRSRPCSVVRIGKWKLIEYFETNEIELFDLSEDIGESKNLSKNRQEVTKSLRNQLKEWRIKTKAAIPLKRNPLYDEKAERKAMDQLKKIK